MTASPITASFGRHETFHPRYGWLKKAVDAVSADPDVFVSEAAPLTLGVGRNMVKAIRFWGEAFGVLEPDPSHRARVPRLRPTDFGQKLLGVHGWDPFLEHPVSLWVLHWRLLEPPCLVPTWWCAFNTLPPGTFTSEDLAKETSTFVSSHLGADPASRTLQRDVECFTRMYSFRRTRRMGYEDALDSPFRELGLLKVAPQGGGAFEMLSSSAGAIPPEAVLFASLCFGGKGPERRISVARLAADRGGPGRTFRLDYHELLHLLEVASMYRSDIAVVRGAAGVDQLEWGGDAASAAMSVLGDAFAHPHALVRAGVSHVRGAA